VAELAWTRATEPATLRRALRHALRRRSPELRVVAEGFLATASPIDLLAIGPEGELVSIRIAPGGSAAEGALLLTRSLADLSWLHPRAADLAALSPALGLAVGAEPRALLVAPGFDAELMAAAEAMPPQRLELVVWRGLRHQGQLELILEPVSPRSDRMTAAPAPDGEGALPDPPRTSGFRTGLTDADLQLEPDVGKLH
jgi:hypothetical protein